MAFRVIARKDGASRVVSAFSGHSARGHCIPNPRCDQYRSIVMCRA